MTAIETKAVELQHKWERTKTHFTILGLLAQPFRI